jgi:HD superfamily phosphodiesterase
MNLAETIKSAEVRFRQILEHYFTVTWGKTVLYSHNIDHHRRVWYYTKELLAEIDISGEDISITLPEKLIIACYTHDLGMSIDPGTRHGILSRELCKSFLKRNKLNETDYSDVLNAIEYHDDKEYRAIADKSDILLSILSISDDLDAFGYIGIYRYFEIYLTRGIQPEIIGHEIRNNALKRYQNFESAFKNKNELIERHKKRYQVVDDFLEGYNRQIEDYSFNRKSNSWNVEITNIFSDMIEHKVPPYKIESEYSGVSKVQEVNNFIGKLSSELNGFKADN